MKSEKRINPVGLLKVLRLSTIVVNIINLIIPEADPIFPLRGSIYLLPLSTTATDSAEYWLDSENPTCSQHTKESAERGLYSNAQLHAMKR